MGLGPFDLTGGPFLTLYGVLLVLTIAAGFAIPRWLRPEGRWGRVDDAESLAYLAGGPTRYAEAVVAQLLSQGALLVSEKTRLRIRQGGAGGTPAERTVLALSSPARWRDVTQALKDQADTVYMRLAGKGLAIDAGTVWRIRCWQTAPYIALLAFGAIKLMVGSLRERPIEYLGVLMILTLTLATMRFMALDKRTRAGMDALENARLESNRLRRAPRTEEAGLAVALFGTTVLAGSFLSDFHQLRRSDSGGDGGSGSDGDGGGGGCGGCGD